MGAFDHSIRSRGEVVSQARPSHVKTGRSGDIRIPVAVPVEHTECNFLLRHKPQNLRALAKLARTKKQLVFTFPHSNSLFSRE